ncbi:hypothetical protein PG994_013727 [Apiospora phragmitis]|uniref:SsuA/THI5-like domain-containing protein n=1 Tax=Apiospora phragmitis TaxID=2905665 RepID=A0ABR1T9G1_9PEZI
MNVMTLWCLMGIVGSGGVHAATPVAYGSFVKSATYSIANQLGYFADEGLDVTYSPVPNSSFAYDGLLAGTYDILTGTIDNAVNLAFNSNANLTVLGQLDQGSDIVLAATSEITMVQALLDGHLSNGSAVYATVLTYPYTAFLEGDTGASTPSSCGAHVLARVADFVAPFSSQALTPHRYYFR